MSWTSRGRRFHPAGEMSGAVASPEAGEAAAGNVGLAANGGPQASASGRGAGDRKRRRRKRRREVRPPGRRCDDCLAFLTDRKTKEIPCTGCQTPIHWPPESQLQTHLGNWAEPSSLRGVQARPHRGGKGRRA